MTKIEVPVLVVGGGPAGLTASLLLSGHGVRSLLVERRSAASLLPRARGVHARAMEILRGCGAEQAVRERELVLRGGAEWRERLAGPPVREYVTGGPGVAAASPCAGASLSQDVFEQALRDQAQARPAAELRFGTELVSFEVVDGGVDALLRDDTGVETAVRARFLVAADGVRSAVRERLGIPLDGPADLGVQRAVSFRADLTPWTGAVPRGIYFLTGSGAVLLSTHPDDRWTVNVSAAPGAGAEARVREALELPELPVEVLAEGRWTAVARVARRFAEGPVFLVGDAAHQAPPVGATGVSTAMHDVHNLGWKLAAVLDGSAGAALLSTYAAEREPVARRVVEEARTAWEAMAGPSAMPFRGRSLPMIDMGYRYASGAVVDDGSPDRDGDGEYVPVADPGCRAPHLWLDGGARSTLDLFGHGLVLLTAPDGDGWRAAAPTEVTVHRIDEPGFAEAYGIGPRGAVLVRPDGHVAWRCAAASERPAAVLADVVARVLCRAGGVLTTEAARSVPATA